MHQPAKPSHKNKTISLGPMETAVRRITYMCLTDSRCGFPFRKTKTRVRDRSLLVNGRLRVMDRVVSHSTHAAHLKTTTCHFTKFHRSISRTSSTAAVTVQCTWPAASSRIGREQRHGRGGETRETRQSDRQCRY